MIGQSSSFHHSLMDLLAGLPDCVFLLDREGGILSTSGKSEALFGKRPSSLKSTHFSSLFLKPGRPAVQKKITSACEAKQPRKFVAEARRGEHKSFPALVMLCPGSGNGAAETLLIAHVLDCSDIVSIDDSTQRKYREIGILTSIMHSMTESLDLEDILHQTLVRILNDSPYEAGGVFVFNEKTRSLFLRASCNLNDTLKKRWRNLPHTEDLPGLSFRQTDPYPVEQNGRSPESDLCRNAGLTAFLGIPLVSMKRVEGVLFLASEETHVIPDRRMNDFLFLIGRQIATSISNAQLFEETMKISVEISSLCEIGRQITSSIRPERLFPEIMKKLNILIRFTKGMLFLVNPGSKTIQVAASKNLSEEETAAAESTSRSRFQSVLEDRRPLLVPENHEDYYCPGKKKTAPSSLICSPLIFGNRCLGAILIEIPEPNAYTGHHLYLLQSFTSFASIAVENARLYGALLNAKERTG